MRNFLRRFLSVATIAGMLAVPVMYAQRGGGQTKGKRKGGKKGGAKKGGGKQGPTRKKGGGN